MLTYFLLYCLLGSCGLAVYGSADRSDSAVRDWTYSILLVLAWPLIMIAVIYKIFWGRP
jgi:hypothetical protein